jgi:hypothetical protein
MSQKFMIWKSALMVAGLLLWVSSCSKENEATPAPAAPTAESSPAVTMKEPEAATAPASPKAPATSAAEPAPVASSGDAIAVRARFDGYSARVSANLWQPIPLTKDVANFALLIPQETLAANSGLVVEGGPGSLAVGTVSGMLKTTDGRPLIPGQEYTFSFRKADAIWSVEITAVR